MAAGNTYVAIAEQTLGSATASVTFSSISAAYTDLVLVFNGYNATVDGGSPFIRFNSDTTTNYSYTWLSGDGTSATSGRDTSKAQIGLNLVTGWDTTSTQPGMNIVHIMNYANTTTYKTVLGRSSLASATYPGTEAVVGLWRKTPEAINTILISLSAGGTFAIGTTFSLYGILAA
jgi:hypothetical protein